MALMEGWDTHAICGFIKHPFIWLATRTQGTLRVTGLAEHSGLGCTGIQEIAINKNRRGFNFKSSA